MSPMHISVNGQPKNIADRSSLRDLVMQTSKQPEYVIAEVNGAIVPKQDWIRTSLNAGDTIELVAFVGGG